MQITAATLMENRFGIAPPNPRLQVLPSVDAFY
jgi:hypothetical protein